MTAAQVVLMPSSLGRADQVKERFVAAGFQAGQVVGVSFSIAAPVEQFEHFFKVRADPSADRPFPGDQLPLSALDLALQTDVQAVLLTRPPDFGPGQNY